MRTYSPRQRCWTAVALASLLSACQQFDQALPFALADGETATRTVGADGGIVSIPPSFSLDFPQGSLSGSVTVEVAPRSADPFPADRGAAVRGTAFDIAPVGTTLATPARVELAVDPALLEAGEDVRLALALIRQDGSVATFQGTYDVTDGILAADIDELGPVAAVVAADAIPVDLESPPSLGGGSIAPPSAPAPSGPALATPGGVEFTASCSPDGRPCFSSGLIRLWADDVVRERLGDRIFLVGPSVEASLDFIEFDANGVPTQVVGSVRIDGALRARLNTTVTKIAIDDGVSTGPSTDPTPTPLQISGNLMILSQTTGEDGTVELDEQVEFGVTGIGTSEMLVMEVEADIDFDNEDGSVTTGVLTAHVRLRR